jgi:hydrogenase expression/formation protein HypC
VPEAKIGDYTIVHVGFALNIIDEEEAKKTLDLMAEVGLIDEEFRDYSE